MANVTQRIKDFLRSPAAKRLIAEGRKQLANPENQKKIKAIAAKVTKRR